MPRIFKNYMCSHITSEPLPVSQKTVHPENNNGNKISYYKIIFRTLKSFHTTYLGKDLAAFERQEYVYLLNGHIKYFSYSRGATSIILISAHQCVRLGFCRETGPNGTKRRDLF